MSSAWKYGVVELDHPFSVLQYDRTPTYDGPNYLHTVHTMTVCGIYSVRSTCYAQSGTEVPKADIDRVAGTTDKAIRHYLSQARRQLIYRAGRVEVLRCPDDGSVCDAANGPFPEVHSVKPYGGPGTFQVVMTVRCHVNESRLFTSTIPVMLSHLWDMTHDIDQDYFTTRTIRGHAAFRRDRLELLSYRPDDFRAYLFHPVPAGWKREDVQVVVDEDNLTAHYQVMDREQASMIRVQGVTRIEAFESRGQTAGGWEDTLVEMTASGLDAAFEAARAASMAWDPVRATAAGGAALARGTFAVGQAFYRNAPRGHIACTVRAWGNPNCTRKTLQETVAKFLAMRLGNSIGAKSIVYNHDLMGRFVEGVARYDMGPFETLGEEIAVNNLEGLMNVVRTAYKLPNINFPSADSVEPITTTDAIAAIAGNQMPPNDSGSRGTYIGALVAQALLAADTTPSRPTDPPNSISRTP